MANKVRLRAKRKNLDHLRCEFKIYATPFGVLEAEMQHKDKYCVGAFPPYCHNVMDEDAFIRCVHTYLCQMLKRLKEATDDATD